MTKPTIYVSGPIKGNDDFEREFAAAADEIREWADPVNPVEIDACRHIETDSKHPDFGLFECRYPGDLLPTGHTWQCYMRHDIEKLVHCDGIYMMRGWENSKGACEEVRIAQVLGMQVSFQNNGAASVAS